jgi:hypothetical protein
MRTVEERFWEKVNKDGPEVRSGLGKCWLWTGAKDSSGYGRHLYAGTKKNNAQDRERRGRSNHATGDRHGTSTHPGLHRGKKNGRSKINEDIVMSIRGEVKAGTKKASLARLHGLSKTSIGHIVNGKLWGHLPL